MIGLGSNCWSKLLVKLLALLVQLLGSLGVLNVRLVLDIGLLLFGARL